MEDSFLEIVEGLAWLIVCVVVLGFLVTIS